jgi:protein-S-isoprenylcysteine O-methyltransferase Ste14
MRDGGAFFARWRVRLGYPLAIVVLLLARPTTASILWAMPVGLIGLLIRGVAAGYLHKQEVLTVSGPYAYTRNPLYLGSAVLAIAVSIATRSWICAMILCGYFVLFYSLVMRREEAELRQRHGVAFDQYAAAVPLFFPRLTRSQSASSTTGSFSLEQYEKNREYRAAIGFVLLLAILLLIWWLRSHR